MLIGISGKINSGKDTVGNIIQDLTKSRVLGGQRIIEYNTFEIKKFADTLKIYLCMAIGCTREQLEDREFKDKELGEEWTNYGYAKGFWYHSDNNPSHKMMDSVPCSKERYEEELRVNWQTAYKQVMTPRLMLQLMGTEAMRNQVHPNFWVNALMSGYPSEFLESKNKFFASKGVPNFEHLKKVDRDTYNAIKQDWWSTLPNWVITDCRFPNELKAVEDRGGITIRVERPIEFEVDGKKVWLKYDDWIKEQQFNGAMNVDAHPSETALDNAKFKYTISNDGSLEDLVEKVREILTLEKII